MMQHGSSMSGSADTHHASSLHTFDSCTGNMPNLELAMYKHSHMVLHGTVSQSRKKLPIGG